jgi:hypothetical protein
LRTRASLAWMAVALLAWAAPAGAFWPLTTTAPPLVPDSLGVATDAARYEAWKKGEVFVPPVPGATNQNLPKQQPPPGSQTPGSQPPPGGEPPPGSMPPPGTGDAAVDSLHSAATGDSTRTASTATSATDSLQTPATRDTTGAGGTPGSTGTSGPTGNQTNANNAAMRAAAAALQVERGCAPDLNSKMTSTNDFMRMTTDLAIGFVDPTGISLSTGIGYGEDISLTQKTDTETSHLTNNFAVPLANQGLNFAVSTSNGRTATTGAKTYNANVTNSFSDNRGASLSAGISRRLEAIPGLDRWPQAMRGWSANGAYARSSNASSQDISATQATEASFRERQSLGNSFGGGVGFDRWKWFNVRARAGFQRADNRDRGSGLAGELESESQGDTASVDVALPPFGRRFQKTTLSLRTSNGVDTNTEPARNANGTQTGVIGNYVLETKYSFNRTISLSTGLNPVSGLDLAVAVNASHDSASQVLKRNSFRDTQHVGWTLTSKYIFWKDASLAANWEANDTKTNLDEGGRPNSGTNRTQDRKLFAEVTKNFTKTLQLHAFGEIQLAQQFFTHEGLNGKNDKDELRQRIGADLHGNIGPQVTAQATMYMRTYDQAYIDPRQSRSTRNETEYVVRPSYTWQMNERASVGQSFGLSSKVIENPYQPQQNTLNRSHFMSTTMDYKLTARLQLNAGYDYLLQDNGQYLRDPVTRESYFAPTQRTKKDGIRMGISYDVIKEGKLTFVSRQESTRERTFTAINERGNLALGITSKLDFSGLKLDCQATGNRSFNVSLNQRTYFNVDATLQYTF